MSVVPVWIPRAILLMAVGALTGASPSTPVSVTSRVEPSPQPTDPETSVASGSSGAPYVASDSGQVVKITFLGDSLTVGIGLRTDDAYPTLVQKRFNTDGYRVEVVNSSLIGQTSADGVRQLGEVLEPDVRILVIALGSNDALRGIALDQTRQNLATIIEAARSRGVRVLLAGMEPPVNLGMDYQQGFRAVFTRLSSEYKSDLTYMPSLLEGVLGNPALNQADGVRPNAEGEKVIAQNMFSRLQVLVDSLGGGS